MVFRKLMSVSALLVFSALSAVSIAQSETGASGSWDNYLQQFSTGQSSQELAKLLPQNVELDSGPGAPISNSWTELNAEYQRFFELLDALNANNPKLADASLWLAEADLKSLNSLRGPALKLRARHSIYLSHLDGLKKQLSATVSASEGAARIAAHQSAYLSQVAAFFSALDLLLAGSEQADSSLIDQVLAGFDMAKLNAQAHQLAATINARPTQILRSSELPHRSLEFNTRALVIEPAITPSYYQMIQFRSSITCLPIFVLSGTPVR